MKKPGTLCGVPGRWIRSQVGLRAVVIEGHIPIDPKDMEKGAIVWISVSDHGMLAVVAKRQQVNVFGEMPRDAGIDGFSVDFFKAAAVTRGVSQLAPRLLAESVQGVYEAHLLSVGAFG